MLARIKIQDIQLTIIIAAEGSNNVGLPAFRAAAFTQRTRCYYSTANVAAVTRELI